MSLTRRDFSKILGASAIASVASPLMLNSSFAMSNPKNNNPEIKRGIYLIKNAAIITVDPHIGTLPMADIIIRNGIIDRIGKNLSDVDAEIIDATNMIVMPGFVNAHYHMWSAIGRSFTAKKEGFSYYPAKFATSALYTPDDFYNSVMLASAELVNGGTTTVHNWSHNTRSPEHADAELRAHQESFMRARYSYGHVDRLAADKINPYNDIDRVQRQWFGINDKFEGMVHLGLNLRGTLQSDEATFYKEMEYAKKVRLPVAIHAPQEGPNSADAVEYEKRQYLGPDFLIAHYISARDEDLAAMARTKTPITIATHSELRLSSTGDARAVIMKMRESGLCISLSSDATSIAPPDMFEMMRFTWNLGVPWTHTPSANFSPIGIPEVIKMATLNGAIALGLGEITGSISEGKRADIIMIRADDLNIAPVSDIETAVVQSATSNNVDTVFIDGKIIKRSGRLIAYNETSIIAKAQSSAKRIHAAAGDLLEP
ncbi:cytosine deaminase [Pseudomonas agarici]|uniref:Cytosine deaminase n=1 Tax=Pseudomonas agarici TaxID=46677 RepID=A0A0X1T7G1_PSEAA|nr:amidohydrolase family protein [Pseudomonas agarici]AMB88057.1 cytosine deaminase [Pseudomonas agarici]NWB92940.1 amidohydrolase family protein [Pseudomonas agarici]NWC09207.1 amidohydrolase family protein [Pseudomonas agarici]SEK31696.1 Cytosine/adenosine deaminase [Pseudomonas agarici]